MKEKPILFSGPMVRAILDGRKTQTRRVIKPQPFMMDSGTWFPSSMPGDEKNKTGFHYANESHLRKGLAQDFCPVQPGDRLWVRETWAPCIGGAEGPMNPTLYRADNLQDYEKLTWKPSIHMPRWASRITLEVTGVRVERVRDITEDDARAEGANQDPIDGPEQGGSYKLGFWDIWDSINAKRGFGWEVNPWVWVYEFKRVRETPGGVK